MKIKVDGRWEVMVLMLLGLLLVVGVRYFGKEYTKELVRIDFTPEINDGRGGQYYANWYNGVLKVGDEERGPDGKVTATIKKIDSYQQADDRYKYYLVVELTGLKDKRAGFVKYKGRPIQAGEKVAIDFSKVQVAGVVTHIGEESLLKKNNCEVELNWEDQDKLLASKIKIGGKVVNEGSNETIGLIEGFNLVPSEDRLVLDYPIWGKAALKTSTNKVDVIMKMKLTVENDNGVLLYAGNQKLKAGEPLWIYSDVIDMKEVKVTSVQCQ